MLSGICEIMDFAKTRILLSGISEIQDFSISGRSGGEKHDPDTHSIAAAKVRILEY